MGRSVSIPMDAKFKIFTTIDSEEDYESLINDIISDLTLAYSSLWDSKKWLGAEDRVLMENRIASIGISEYCGVVAIWGVPKSDYYDLGTKWLEWVEVFLRTNYETMKRRGFMSNGAGVYEMVKNEEGAKR